MLEFMRRRAGRRVRIRVNLPKTNPQLLQLWKLLGSLHACATIFKGKRFVDMAQTELPVDVIWVWFLHIVLQLHQGFLLEFLNLPAAIHTRMIWWVTHTIALSDCKISAFLNDFVWMSENHATDWVKQIHQGWTTREPSGRRIHSCRSPTWSCCYRTPGTSKRAPWPASPFRLKACLKDKITFQWGCCHHRYWLIAPSPPCGSLHWAQLSM